MVHHGRRSPSRWSHHGTPSQPAGAGSFDAFTAPHSRSERHLHTASALSIRNVGNDLWGWPSVTATPPHQRPFQYSMGCQGWERDGRSRGETDPWSLTVVVACRRPGARTLSDVGSLAVTPSLLTSRRRRWWASSPVAAEGELRNGRAIPLKSKCVPHECRAFQKCRIAGFVLAARPCRRARWSIGPYADKPRDSVQFAAPQGLCGGREAALIVYVRCAKFAGPRADASSAQLA